MELVEMTSGVPSRSDAWHSILGGDLCYRNKSPLFMHESFCILNWTSATVASLCCRELLVLSATSWGELCFYLRMGWFLIFELLFGLLPIQFHFEPPAHANCLIYYPKIRVLQFVCLLRSWTLLTYPHKAIPWLSTLFHFLLLVFAPPPLQLSPVGLLFATSQTLCFYFFIRVWELICLENCFSLFTSLPPQSILQGVSFPQAEHSEWVTRKTLREPELVQ